MATRFVIATPTPGTVKTAYMRGVFVLLSELVRNGIEAGLNTRDGSDIAMLRNVLASQALANGADFIFFLDSDVVVRPDLVLAMLKADKPLIGALYPYKIFDLARFAAAAGKGLPSALAKIDALPYWSAAAEDGRVPADVPCFRVLSLGTGAMLIRRDVLATMVADGVASPSEAAPWLRGPFKIYNFFSPRPQENPAGYVSEDAAFCKRWRVDCGGEIWAMTDQTACVHIGDFAYGL